MATTPRERRTSWWEDCPRTLVLATVLIAVGFATGVPLAPHSRVEGAIYDLLLMNAAPLVASLACFAAARRVPDDRLVWWGAAAATLLNVLGNVVYALAVAPQASPSFPSVADGLWLAGYVPLFVLAWALLRARLPRPGLSTWLDGLVGALGVTAVAASAFITPAVTAQHLAPLATAANVAYLVADVVLLTLLGAVPAVLGARIDGAVAILCVVLVSKLAGDAMVAAAQAGDGYVPGGALDLTWMVNAVLTAGAAAAARPRRHGGAGPERVTWQALVVPLSCTLAALVVLGVEWGDGDVSLGEVCALACVLSFLARTTLTFQELRSLREVRHQAITDHLTGLPNRRALETELERMVNGGVQAAVILLDLDGFKAVNDRLGHRAGDELLRKLGERLRPALRPGDLLFRLGGDEFAVLLPDAPPNAADECARRLHALVGHPVDVAGVTVEVGASLGITEAPNGVTSIDELLHRADLAMYAAKSAQCGVRWFPDAGHAGPTGSESGLSIG